jgi:integrase
VPCGTPTETPTINTDYSEHQRTEFRSLRRDNWQTGPVRRRDGLYLIVSPTGAKRWQFLFRWQGKLKEMGLGSQSGLSLSDARERALAARKLLANGANPIEARRSSRASDQGARTFGQEAGELVDSLSPGFRAKKHGKLWGSTLRAYAAPIWNNPVGDVETTDVLTILRPIWNIKNETASRVRGRIERVLDAAAAHGRRTGNNPARWRGHLDKLLSARPKRVKHHPALPYPDVPGFVAELREREGMAALALEFSIMTAARTSEVLGARWSEVDRTNNLWAVPAERMKSERMHRVPLTGRAMAILDRVEQVRPDPNPDGFIFEAERRGRSLSIMAMAMLLRRMGRHNITVHGFRSSFRDWAGDEKHFPREVAEAALAHVIGDEAEQAYAPTSDRDRANYRPFCCVCSSPLAS